MRSEHGKASLARRDFIAAGVASLGWLAAGNAKAAAAASPYDPPAQSDPRSAVNALVFDVFGTVVDWCGSIIREGNGPVRTSSPATSWISPHSSACSADFRSKNQS